MAEEIEHLLCKCKALSPNTSPPKKKKKFESSYREGRGQNIKETKAEPQGLSTSQLYCSFINTVHTLHWVNKNYFKISANFKLYV
jgi:hypothetical protein